MIALYLSLAIFFEENIRAGVFSKNRFQKNARAEQSRARSVCICQSGQQHPKRQVVAIE